MDRELLRRKAEEHKDRVLRFDRCLLRRFGLIRNSVYLKIGDYYLNCVPFELSLVSSRAIAVLGRNEIEFFSEFIGGLYNFHITIEHEDFSKPLGLFLKVRITGFRQYNPETNVCIIEMDHITVPNDFQEVFVGVSEELVSSRRLYDEEGQTHNATQTEEFRNHVGAPYFSIRSDTDLRVTGKVTTLTPRTMKLFVDMEDVHVEPGMRVELEHEETGVVATGSVSQLEPLSGTPDFAFISIELQFSFGYVNLLRSMLPVD